MKNRDFIKWIQEGMNRAFDRYILKIPFGTKGKLIPKLRKNGKEYKSN